MLLLQPSLAFSKPYLAFSKPFLAFSNVRLHSQVDASKLKAFSESWGPTLKALPRTDGDTAICLPSVESLDKLSLAQVWNTCPCIDACNPHKPLDKLSLSRAGRAGLA